MRVQRALCGGEPGDLLCSAAAGIQNQSCVLLRVSEGSALPRRCCVLVPTAYGVVKGIDDDDAPCVYA